MTQPHDDANDLLMSGGIKSIGWKENPVGHTVVGTIIEQPKKQQMTKFESTDLAFWPSGDPMWEIVCTIQTELRDPSNPYDDGKRKLHISPRMMTPVRTAVQKATAPGLAIGGRIAVQRTGGTGATGSPFEFAAEYQPPAVDPDSMLGGNGQAAAATPTSAAQPAAAAPVQAQGSLLAGGGQPAALQKPANVDQAKWDALSDVQREAVVAAMSSAVPF